MLFSKQQRTGVILSDMGIIAMLALLEYTRQSCGLWNVMKYYGIPWILTNHWLAMGTFLQHTDPKIPHYRGSEWTFARGAAATVDRDFLGFSGKFFLHGVCNYHVVHHFFPGIPMCACIRALETLVSELTSTFRSCGGSHHAPEENPGRALPLL